MSDQRQ